MADWTAGSPSGTLSAVRYGAPAPQRRQPEEARASAGPAGLAGASRTGAYPFKPRKPEGSASGAFAGFDGVRTGGLAKARLAVWIGGGVLSLALVAGIGVWGYRLVLRDVLGVPVVQAEAGPMRVAPDEPGGSVAADMGLSVNAVAAAGEAAAPSDVLTLAPTTTDLADEDMTIVQTSAEAGDALAPEALVAPSVAAAPLDVADVAQTAAELPVTEADRVMTADEVQAFADQIAAGAVPLDALAPGTVPATTAAIPATVPGVATALRPLIRPARAATLTVSESVDPPALPAAAPVETASVEPAPEAIALTAAIAPGTNLVQLGAFDSAEIAASEWVRLSAEFADFMGGRERVIQEAESGGRTFFRLRATGFADLGDARRFCAALEAEEANCIPVVVN